MINFPTLSFSSSDLKVVTFMADKNSLKSRNSSWCDLLQKIRKMALMKGIVSPPGNRFWKSRCMCSFVSLPERFSVSETNIEIVVFT